MTRGGGASFARNLGGSVLGALAFTAMALVGRATVPEGTAFGLIWPAGGAAVLWLLLTSRRWLPINVVLLGLAAFLVNILTGAPIALACVLLATNVVQAVGATLALRRLCPELWGCGGEEAIGRLSQVGRIVSTFAAASVLATGAGTIAFHAFLGPQPAADGFLWLGRNLCGLLLIVVPGLLVGQRLATGPLPRSAAATTTRSGTLELDAAFALTVILYALTFSFGHLPLAFPLLVPSVWIGARFSTLITTLHSMVAGGAAVALTLAGLGPFAQADSIIVGSLSVQYFVIVVMILGLALAAGRAERLALAEQLAEAEQAASQRAALYDAVFSSMSEGVNVLDEDGKFVITNPAAARLLGLADATAANTSSITAYYLGPDSRVIPPDRKPSALALAGETVRQMDVVYHAPDGERRTFSVSASPLPAGVDGKRRAVLVFDDVTAERLAQAELTEFAWVVAHDLKSPLTAMELWVHTAADELDSSGAISPDFARKFTEGLARSTKRMRQLIDDLIQHASAETVDLVRTPVDLKELVSRVLRMRGSDHAVTVTDLPTIVGDEVLLRLAFNNVIDNALKFVAPDVPPNVRVSGVVVGDEAIIRIADNGIGMPAGSHDLMFAEFERGAAQEYTGTGLGLAIVRRVLTRHDGTVRAYDNPAGSGTIVEFRLPKDHSE